MFTLNAHIEPGTVPTHVRRTCNWNWYHRDFTRIRLDAVNMNIDLTLSTGASAIPLGICSVMVPRFKYALHQIVLDNAYIRYSPNKDDYPIDEEIALMNFVISRLETDNPINVNQWSQLYGCSQRALLGSSLIKTNKGHISTKSVMSHILIDIMRQKYSETHFNLAPADTIIYHIQTAPNFFNLGNIIEVELCLFECKYPIDLLMVLLGVIGEMMW